MPAISPITLGVPAQLVPSALHPVGTLKPAVIPWPSGANRFEYAPQMSDADATNDANSMTVTLWFSTDGGNSFSKATYLWSAADRTTEDQIINGVFRPKGSRLVERDGVTPARPRIAINMNPKFPITHVQVQADIHAPITTGLQGAFL